ncbi:hypothetical protein [Anaeromyxobacter paludicola]|uniref:DUF4203 domain-containing protein n=1 Tax=Anaeromyxobacter paludicola TaxID=2918171 RepID=A0ABN6N4N7_9BACT|nr:hypothetical protein [Anaeromyxobacter paludicola]BDG08135.1 hypothetical protein AMPC_12480 [Anaeromyxobacter paludicola]
MVDLPGIGASLLDGVTTLSQHAAALRELPWPAAAALVAIGAGALAAGARHRRAVAALGGAVCGFAAAHFLARFVVPLDLAPEVAGYGGALLLLAGCAAFPPAFVALAGALPGALVGEHFRLAGHAWWGMAAGAALGAALAFLVPRLLAACTAAAVGAALACTGLVALSGALEPLEILSRRPFLTAGLWGALAVAGAAFQLQTAWGGGEGTAAPGGRKPGKAGRRPKGKAPRARAAEGAG